MKVAGADGNALVTVAAEKYDFPADAYAEVYPCMDTRSPLTDNFCESEFK
jgi:hypothetical protein